MSNIDLPEIPASMKNIQHYLKIASEHDKRDPIISYWARFYAAQTAINQSKKSPDETNFLLKLMTWLENTKKELHDNDSITNDVAAQAYLENYALKIFTYADKLDRTSNFSKNLVLSFYTAGFLYDILTTFGGLSEESSQNRKYAKWKAAYIHNCLKNGETPIPGPINEKEGNDSTNYKSESDNEATSNNNNCDLPSVSNDQSPNTNPVDSGSGHIPTDHNSQSSDDTFIAVSNAIKSSGGRQNFSLNADQILKAQKYIKWAGSAINYDDISTAVENLQKALCLLTTGKDG